MLRLATIGLGVGTLAVSLLAGACGAAPSGTADTGDDFAPVDDGGTGGDNSAPSDGGTVDLTPEQVEAIQGSECTGWNAEGEALPAVLQFVVDVSGSMEEEAPGSDQSKWQVTRDAVEAAIADFPPSVAVGVLYYPNQETQRNESPGDVTDCVNVDELVPIGQLGQDGSAQRDLVNQSLRDADTGNYTPTHDAYKYAFEESLRPYETNSKKFMLLITDGAPTLSLGCVNPPGGDPNDPNQAVDAPTDPIIEAIQAAHDNDGVTTFLIGSPGSEESSQGNQDMRPWLSQAAVVGGSAEDGCEVDGPNFCHLDMTQEPDFSAALTAGLSDIAGRIVDRCTFAIPTPPPGQTVELAKTNVYITWGDGQSTLILRDNQGDCTVGWQTTTDGQISLCSESCDAIKSDSGATLNLSFGCETSDVITITK